MAAERVLRVPCSIVATLDSRTTLPALVLSTIGAVVLRLAQLVVGVERDLLLVAFDRADRRHRVGGLDGAAHLLEAQPHGGEQAWG